MYSQKGTLTMNKYITYLLTFVLAGSMLSGCGGGSASAPSYAKEEAAYDYATDDVYANGAYDSYAEEAMEEVEAPAEAGIESTPDSQIKTSDRKIIKTVNITTETEEFDVLIDNISKKVDALGGYLESTDISGRSLTSSSKQRRSANITARVPSQNLNQFVTIVNDNSNITYKSENAEDVTLNYADTKAKIDSLRTEQTRLNELIAQAEDVDTLIILEQRLTEVRYEIESYESRLRTMDNKVDYSTVYLSINEVEKYTPDPIIEKTMGQRIIEGFTENMADAIELIEDFIVGLISSLPVLLVLIVIFGFIALIIFLIVKLIIYVCKKASSRKGRTPKKVKAPNNAAAKPVNAPVKAPENPVNPESSEAGPYNNPVAKEDKKEG